MLAVAAISGLLGPFSSENVFIPSVQPNGLGLIIWWLAITRVFGSQLYRDYLDEIRHMLSRAVAQAVCALVAAIQRPVPVRGLEPQHRHPVWETCTALQQ